MNGEPVIWSAIQLTVTRSIHRAMIVPSIRTTATLSPAEAEPPRYLSCTGNAE